ncbi:hypothetical protein [Thalassotalea piscium]|uniref:Glucan phosphoethanolaminetransferase (Alkaline phosphatase superfamily) n=1 Tax=Thalassotalea piscium TaxID=1230533 RepID=A0A7X0NHA9_9GAMM|nr:hypothetical protein [Thalassotalea piscium]MBB6543459.1 glucan phosphoethanolaminetransferase (alkaline phosphatase superfamily) [Thalassotalea piscium]
MSFFKSLCLAIAATLFLTYVFGISLIEFFNVDIYMDETHIEPLKAISISALVVVLLVFAALAIILSVFGTIIFVGLLVVGSLVMVMIGVFWPILIAAGVIWLIVRDKPKKQKYA